MKTALIPIALLSVATTAHAALILGIDTVTQQFALFGSDTGTPEDFGTGYAVFNSISPTILVEELFQIPAGYAFTSTNTPAGILYVNFWELGTPDDFGLDFEFEVPGLLTTVNGTGNPISYSAFDPSNQLALESLIGSNLQVVNGSGFQDIAVQAVSIPEPSVFAGLIGSAALLMAVRRRRK